MKTVLPIVPFATARKWEAWLERHHANPDGLWMKLAKKASGIPSIIYAEALEIALCHGWIDGLKRPLDGDWWLQHFTPRRPRSKWSKVNCAKALELIEQGRMKPAGLREIERAQRDGRWEAAYDSPRTATIPPDFAAALKQNAKARKFFETLSGANRYAILFRIHDAKRPETRARRIAQFVAMLAAGGTLH